MKLFFFTLTMFTIPSVIISGPIWIFARKKVNWLAWEYFTFLLPFFVWFILVYSNLIRNKSLSNAGVEPLLIGVLVGLSQLIRVVMPELFGGRIKSWVLVIVIQIVIAISVYFLMPNLPE